jgi:hypothetical protein
MIKKYIKILLILLPLYYTLCCCKDTSTYPPPNGGTDTTSHDFSIEIFSWGHHSSSLLRDVAIINENEIWAVGKIHTEDTDCWNEDSTEWIPPYNAVHWDGEKWELKRIYVNYRGEPNWAPLEGVFAFSKNDIWFSSGLPYKPVGDKWTLYHLWDMGVLDENDGGVPRMWGTSSDDMYFAGRKGTIVHYDGQSWQKIESGTDLTIQDIWGSYDDETDESYILCPACLKFEAVEPKLLCINSDHSVSEENWPYPNNDTYSVWFKDKDNVFICGGGAYKRDFQGKYTRFTQLPKIFMNRIRGNDINDIFIAGDFGILAHYNGKNWREFTEFNEVNSFWSLDFKNDIAVAVGYKGIKAVIYMIKRN